MNYEFATIRHIDDARAAIAGREEFIEAKRDGFTVFNYIVSFPQTFPPVKQVYCNINSSGDATLVDGDLPVDEIEYNDETAAILRELRGLTFCNETGQVIARKLHKFFNIGEKEECRVEEIDWSKPHWIEEKLDDSMITPVRLASGETQWHTKMGKTAVADQVLPFLEANPNYRLFANLLLDRHSTPIFEWCSPKQRIVINHKEDRLVLLAIRDHLTGRYMSRAGLQSWARTFGIDLVRTFGTNIEDINKFLEETRNLTDTEGFVVTFADGHKVKVKCDWYVRLHKTKDRISHERYVVELIANEQVDDILPVLMDDDRKMVEEYFDAFTREISFRANRLSKFLEDVPEGIDRKTFAVEYASKLNSKEQSIAFRLFGLQKQEIRLRCYQELINVLKKGVNSNRHFAEVKQAFFPDIKYRGIWNTDE